MEMPPLVLGAILIVLLVVLASGVRVGWESTRTPNIHQLNRAARAQLDQASADFLKAVTGHLKR